MHCLQDLHLKSEELSSEKFASRSNPSGIVSAERSIYLLCVQKLDTRLARNFCLCIYRKCID